MSLVGKKPEQIPTNSMLGELAYLNKQAIKPRYWQDITPLWTKDDLSGAWAVRTVVGTTRSELTMLGSGGGNGTILCKYHIPHEIDLDLVDSDLELHLHVEFDAATSGNSVIVANIAAALADGTFSAESQLTYTLTPSTLGTLKNLIIKQTMPAGFAAYFKPDSIVTIRFYKDNALAGDTFAGQTIWHTADLHIPCIGNGTTSKDFGSGWVNV